jgi:hypothetical protein
MDHQGFREAGISKWPEREARPIQDFWREMKAATRKFCKGWGINTQSQFKRDKKLLLERISELDSVAEARELSALQWQIRYGLEKELKKVYNLEELQLKRQSGIKWTLKGDANTSFFHGAANGRRKKCSIFYLEEEGTKIRDPVMIRSMWNLSTKIFLGQK